MKQTQKANNSKEILLMVFGVVICMGGFLIGATMPDTVNAAGVSACVAMVGTTVVIIGADRMREL